jgi:hypothetical protein
MNVEKKEEIVIPTFTYLDYYILKSRYDETKKCHNCKKTHIVFDNANRILSCVCQTPKCKSNMRLSEDTYVTYDVKAERCKKDYVESTDKILREKFDLLFDYKKKHKLEELRSYYLANKEEYDSLFIQWEKANPTHVQLQKDRAELIRKLKEEYSPEIAEQLNHVLNEIHAIEYKRVYNEIIPTPAYELEFRVI